jgi:GNAT superfamily N-acetyltransferase
MAGTALGGIRPAVETALVTVGRDGASPEWADRVAQFTRCAYRDSDPLPGLPVPDGAADDRGQVLGFLDRGGSVHSAVAGGTIVASLRTVPAADGSWWISRLAVRPDLRGTGLGGWLLAAVEAEARRAGVPAVQLDAVIERCLLPYYARLGYRVQAYHEPEDGKLLTEARMERDPAAPRTAMRPYPVPDPAVGAVIGWFLTAGGGLAAVVARTGPVRLDDAALRCAAALADPAARLAGLDAWRGAAADLDSLGLVDPPGGLPARDRHGGLVVRFGGGRADLPRHRMPRATHPDMWAVARFPPGSEPSPETFALNPRE